MAWNFTIRSWIPYAIDHIMCYCAPDRPFIPIYNVIYQYLSTAELNQWKNFKKPEIFFYRKNLFPVSHSHYRENHQPPWRIFRDNRIYRREEIRTSTYRYACVDSKCAIKILLNEKLEFKQIPTHKEVCKNFVEMTRL